MILMASPMLLNLSFQQLVVELIFCWHPRHEDMKMFPPNMPVRYVPMR